MTERVVQLNAYRSADQAGMANLRCALARFEKAVEAKERGTAAWEALQARLTEQKKTP